MFLPHDVIGAMKTFMRAAALVCCALVLPAQAETMSIANSFDHARTGYLLRDVHTALMCEQCHVEGIFKNTPRDCAGCHSLGSRVGAKPKSANHPMTTKACDACHTSATSFQIKNFSHAGISTNCTSCHNGTMAGIAGKPANHNWPEQACEKCHINTATFSSTRMNHAGITSNCVRCHDGQHPGIVGKSASHIQTVAACEFCHTSTTTFLGARYDHSTIAAGTCLTCHNGSTATGKTASHIPTTASCDTCHSASNTSNFTTFSGAQFNHTTAIPTVSNACSSCHNGTTATGKPTFHITTPAQCDSSGCHTSSSTQNYTSFLGATFTHSTANPAVTSRCSTCHGGQSAGVSSKPASHIATTAQCDICHTPTNTGNYTTFMGASFVHATATPAVAGRCSTCHGGQSANVSAKPASHIPTTAECDVCHTPSNTGNYTAFVGAIFVHATATPAVAGRCAVCHGGSYAGVVSKPAMHISTSAECDACHTASNTGNYVTFTGAVFNHDVASPSVVGICSTCHNGSIAKGKSSFHTPTSAQCDSSGCHTRTNTSNYTTFLGALVNHSTMSPPVVNRCSECHNGSNALGKAASHITTSSQCDTCHTTSNTLNYTTFRGATFNHSTATPVVAGRCSACHGGQSPNVVKKPSLHITTSVECDVCHTPGNTANYTSFRGATFNHSTATPTVAGSCSSCHNGQYPNVVKKPTLHIATTAECDSSGCHSSSNTQNYTTFTGMTFNHATATPSVTNNCSTCHNGQYPNVVKKPVLHIATAAQCDSSGCHTNTQNYTTFTGVIFNHGTATPSVTGRCSACHNGQYPSVVKKPTLHVATAAECDSSGCHTNSNYTTFAGVAYNHALASPPVAGICSSCHNGVTAIGKTALHISTASQCDACHTSSNTNNYSTFLGASVDHGSYSPAVANRCQQCHNGSAAKGLSVGHIPTGTVSCDGCHKTGYASFANPGMDHTKTSTMRCDVCHNGSYASQGNSGGARGKVAKHIPTTITGALDCNTCHKTSVVASSASMLWSTETMNHNGAQGGGVGGNGAYCVTCHLKGVTYQGSMDKKSHEGTSMSKDCSRSGCHKPLGSKGAAYTRWD